MSARTEIGTGGRRANRRTVAVLALVAGWVAVVLTAAGQTRGAGLPQVPATDVPSAVAAQRAILKQYCLTCHNQTMKERGAVPIALDQLDLSSVTTGAESWEKVVRKIRTGVMPPPGRPRPDQATLASLASWLEAGLDQAARSNANPGRTESFHRLNRAEYQNVVRDLLDLDVDVASLLPPDDASYGFDNIAGVLKMSPTLMERYLTAAQKISRLAVGTPPPVANVDYFRLADDLPQDDHIEGLPTGTRGGIAIRYTFPMDAEYVFRVRLARDLNESVPIYAEPQRLEVGLDGERVGLFTLPGAPRAARDVVPDADQESVQRPQEPVRRGQGQKSDGQERDAQPVAADPELPRPPPGPRPGPRERERRNHTDDNWDVRVRIKAGERNVQVAFIKLTSALDETARLPFMHPFPGGVNTPETRMGAYLRSVEIVGPYAPSGSGDSLSRRRIFVCQPATASVQGRCARTILSRLARRAYRRPVTATDLAPLLASYKQGQAHEGFDAGIERALKTLLVSPEFLFRVERDPANVAPNTPYRISGVELASRLSFFLWSSIPDDELLGLATAGKLNDPTVLSHQAERMIADPRSQAFVKNFAGQWLYLRNLPSTGPVSTNFPDFDDSLRQAFQRETELFFESIVREDRSALELLTANYTFLNERLARHYGIPDINGSRFRRVTLPQDSLRGGLLGQGSILTVTSQPDRTSPVVRGKWILENLLGTSPPSPPPNVPALKATNQTGGVLSMRDRMVQHRANPVCAGCHAIMDPLGLSLENLDAVGQARTLGESSQPIDASGALPDGMKFSGPAGLKQALLTKSDVFVTTVTEKLMTYALGRGLEYYDSPSVRAIVRDAAQHDYKLSRLITGVVQSVPFEMRKSLP
jgi:mono/diheme cytochrome c family protein